MGGALFLIALMAHAADTADAPAIPLDAITVVATGASNMTAASAGDISRAEMESQPLLRPAAILENIPGLVVTQHSGEGKANQYFLRAFNLDHGTDLSLEVDDMPVNMPTHAHGQGYSDFNFVIPELAGDLQYKKGPYYADEGDFATAGTARVSLLNAVPTSATIGFGEDGYRRGLLMASTAFVGGTLIGAGEAYHNDGPFDVPDDYNRLNGVVRYFRGNDRDYFTVTAMTYAGKWNSTDQVPQRAVSEGVIDRFGSLNGTDGGVSNRSSLSLTRVKRTEQDQVQVSAYVIRYILDLWSTFTYFLKDPMNGDQVLQHDDRVVYGFKASKSWFMTLFGASTTHVVGVQARVDDVKDVGIFPTFERQTMGTRQNAGVLESNGAFYAESSTQWSDHLRTTIGLRGDQFDFDVKDKMLNADGSCNIKSDPLGCVSGGKRASIFSPKMGVVLGPWAKTTYFIDIGDGYHSNDARGVTRSGENPAVGPVTALTRAMSGEAGVATTIVPNLESRLDVFELKLNSELVFSGDAGATFPSGATTRTGIEWGNTYQINHWLSAKLNTAFTRARFDHDAPRNDLGCSDASPSNPCTRAIGIVGRYIPNSPTNVTDAVLTAQRESEWFGSLHARHFGESPLVENNSAKSPAYTTVDAQIGFRASKWLVAIDIFNIANVKWNDIKYYYVSRLKNEPSPIPDHMVHPGVPRSVRARFEYQF
ncbi:MAG TPA: TonB-dependent receptor [Steroidobacteraceae bacterium]|nr:TonB-dependent receptor [Steroidobacteraceae bacterium]